MPDVDINQVAHLARIELADAEKAKFAAQLQDMLAYVNQLSRVDVTGVQPTAQAIPLTNVLRKDEVRPSLAVERVLKNAPETTRDLFSVPKIVE